LHRIIHEEATPPSKYVLNLRRDLEAIVLKALEKEKAKRYQTAEAFAKDLERFLQGHRVEALENELQRQIRRWIKKHQSRVIASIAEFLVVCVGMFLKIGLGYQERKALYEKKYQAFLQESTKEGFYPKLQSWNYLNEALQILPNDPVAEKEKWEIGEALLKDVLKQESRYVGDYVIEEMRRLSTLPEEKRAKRFEKWEDEKKAYWKKEEKRFEYWISRMSAGEQVGSEETDALFEILKMSAPTINPRLLEILQEGNLFFERESIEQEKTKARYYQWGIQIVSRRKMKEALPIICEGLSKLSAQYRKFKIPEDLEKIHSMVKMARYLLGIGAFNKADFLSERREETGATSLFYTRIEFIQKKLYQLKLESTENSQDLPQNAQEFYQRGLVKNLSGDFNGAIVDFSEVIRLNPEYALAYINRGNAKYKTKDMDGVINDCGEAIRLNPEYALAYNNRGNAKKDKKDLEGAIRDYNEAIRFNPQSAETYNNRGIAKKDKKDLEGAINDYNEAIRLNPQYTLAYYNRGNTKYEKKDLEGAINDYDGAIRLNPQDALTYHNRGSAKYKKKDLEGEINDYNEAILLNYQDALAYNNRGNAKKDKKDLEGAINDYSEAIRLNLQYAEAYYNRGIVKNLNQDIQGAIEDLETGLSIQVHPQVQELLLNLLKQQSREQFAEKEWKSAQLNLLKFKKYLPLNDPQHNQIEQKLQEIETLLLSEEKQ
ncbi:MAG: tetratricopeptide repeat protein, partial [Planctomycetota bacterium]